MQMMKSSISTEYKDGKAVCTIDLERDGRKFHHEYDPTDEKAEQLATDRLKHFLYAEPEKEKAPKIEVAKEELKTVTQTAKPAEKHRKWVDSNIEKLLSRANNTMSDIDTYRDVQEGKIEKEKLADIATSFSQEALDYIGRDFPAETTTMMAAQAFYGVYLTNIIDRLCWALDNTLGKLDKACYRLHSWGDVQYVADLKEGKV